MVDGFDENARTGMLDTLPFYLNLLPTLSRLEQANRCPAGKLRF